jgi:membrane-bound lytic murein transglycosylase D
MARQNTRDYYRLYLPLETQRYVFRILTAKLILENPERYGFRFEADDLYAPTACEPVTLETDRDVPLLMVAQAAGTYVKTIKDLNPELRGYRLAPGRHTFLVPQGSARGFHERLSQRMREAAENRVEIVYIVREGDTLSGIAERHRVPLADLRAWNRLDAKKSIQPGMRLVIQQKLDATAAEPSP